MDNTQNENNMSNNFTVTIDFSMAQSAFRHDELVFIIDKTDGNSGLYGRIADQSRIRNMPNLREDWREKLSNNKSFEPEWLVVDFGGGYGDKWSKLYHVSQLVNVRLLGQRILDQYAEGKK